MTGAVSEEHAKEQEKLVDADEDAVGEFLESGEPVLKPEGKRKQQEDVIDFPPPIQSEGRDPARPDVEPPTSGQKAQLYTDGISGEAESHLGRAFRLPEALQTSEEIDRNYKRVSDQSDSAANKDSVVAEEEVDEYDEEEE